MSSAPLVKVWICEEGKSDDEAIKLELAGEADVSDVLVKAPLLLDLSNYRPAELQAVHLGTTLSNRLALAALIATHPSGDITLVIKPRKVAPVTSVKTVSLPPPSPQRPPSATAPSATAPSTATNRVSAVTRTSSAHSVSSGSAQRPSRPQTIRQASPSNQPPATVRQPSPTVRQPSPSRRPVPKPAPPQAPPPPHQPEQKKPKVMSARESTVVNRLLASAKPSVTAAVVPPAAPPHGHGGGVCNSFKPQWNNFSCGNCKHTKPAHQLAARKASGATLGVVRHADPVVLQGGGNAPATERVAPTTPKRTEVLEDLGSPLPNSSDLIGNGNITPLD